MPAFQHFKDRPANEEVTYIRISHDCQTVSWNGGVHKDFGADIELTLVDGKIVKACVVEEV